MTGQVALLGAVWPACLRRKPGGCQECAEGHCGGSFHTVVTSASSRDITLVAVGTLHPQPGRLTDRCNRLRATSITPRDSTRTQHEQHTRSTAGGAEEAHAP